MGIEKNFCFYGCGKVIDYYNDTYDKTKKYGINCDFGARSEEREFGVFAGFIAHHKDTLKHGEEPDYYLLTPNIIEELDKMGLDPTQKLKDDVLLSALKTVVRDKYKKI